MDSFRDVETQYMSTTEGIYDVSNDRRHKEIIGINIYDRTTNNVYDVSNPDRQYRDNYTNDFSQWIQSSDYDKPRGKWKHGNKVHETYNKPSVCGYECV